MSNKFFVQINTELDYGELKNKLSSLQEDNFHFNYLNNSAEWLLCETIVDTYIEKEVSDELKPLFIEQRDGLVSRVATSDIIDYNIVEKAIKEYDFDEVVK